MRLSTYIVSLSSFFFPSYRTLGHVGGDSSSAMRRLLLHLVWLLKHLEQRLQLERMLHASLVLLITALLTPCLLLVFAVLQLIRVCTRLFLRYRHSKWHFVNISSLRCALDTHRSPGMITLFVTLDGSVELTELHQHVSNFIQNQPEIAPILRQHIASKLNCYMWKDAKEFDLSNHITVSRGFRRNKTITETILQNHISELCSRPLSKKNPPWEIVLVPLPKTSKLGHCGILFRMHHLIAEQLPMKKVLLPTCMNLWGAERRIPLLGVNSSAYKLLLNFVYLFKSVWQDVANKCNPFNDEEQNLILFWIWIRSILHFCYQIFRESQKIYYSVQSQCTGESFFKCMLHSFHLFILMAKKLGYRIVMSICVSFWWLLFYVVLAPFFTMFAIWQIIKSLLSQIQILALYCNCQIYKDTCEKELIKAAGKELLFAMIAAFTAPGEAIHELTKTVDPIPLLQLRPWSGQRVYAWTPTVSMELIKSISNDVHATPSDVLLASCAGILRHYFRTLGSEIPDNISATIPLCSAGVSEVKDQGFTIVALPTGEADPIIRLQRVQQRMQEIRENTRKYILSVYMLRYASTVLPQPLLTMLLNYFSYKFPVTITNVFITDSAPVALGKNNIKTMNYWRPAQGNIGLSLTLIYYSQSVSLAVASDREVLPQPSLMTSQFCKEFRDMAMMLGLRIDSPTLRASSYRSPQSTSFD